MSDALLRRTFEENGVMNIQRSVQLAVGLCLVAVLSAVGAAEITLFEGPNFQGRSMTFRGETSNLDQTGFNDRTSSIIVRDGVWEACVDAYFQGGCTQFQPGEYAQLEGRFDRSISSLRVLNERPYAERDRGPGRRDGRFIPQDGRGARAILFEGPNFQGRSFPMGGDVVANLDGTGFNDRASSIRVEDGYWIFCSDAQFQGDCQTFGPGDYPTLPWGLDRKISSGRRIHERYPYEGRPNWNR
jgi:hypothetical protein